MPTFRVNDWGDGGGSRPPDSITSLFDGLINAAGGRALPGRWGLAQALLSCISHERKSHPVIHWTKTGLNVAGVVRDYRRANDPKAVSIWFDAVTEWLKAEDMTVPQHMERLGSMLLAYSSTMTKEEIRPDKATDNERIRLYRTPDGVRYAFRIWGHADQEYNHGPFVRRDQHEAFVATINEVIWAAEQGNDLQLTTNSSHVGPPTFQLSNIGQPGDYVTDEADGTSLGAVVARCQAFLSRGMSRNILFYGPPGTGKSTVARSIAQRLGGGHTLRVEAKAVENAGVGPVLGFLRLLRPSVVLFDDMDRCMSHAVDLLHTIEQGAIMPGMMMVGTVNVVSQVDPALLRPGRFDEVVEVLEPGDRSRLRIVEHYVATLGLSLTDSAYPTAMSSAMAGFSPADIREVLQCVAAVGFEHFDAEVARVKRQRLLYAGDACGRYAGSKRMDSIAKAPTPYPR